MNYVVRSFESTDHQHSNAADDDDDDDDDDERTFVALILDSLLHHDCTLSVIVSIGVSHHIWSLTVLTNCSRSPVLALTDVFIVKGYRVKVCTLS